MSIGVSVADLLEYTGWERAEWRKWLSEQPSSVLEITAGPHGDGRFAIIGDLIRHIFSAEKRYVERLLQQPLTDAASIPNKDAEALFQFGDLSRKEMRRLLETFPAEEWDRLREFKVLDFSVTATPRKIVVHTLMHEIRHWAQIATILRLNGLVAGFHDFLGSPVFGGGFTREP
jgi:uncharacterized damage-inducible protein DinB